MKDPAAHNISFIAGLTGFGGVLTSATAVSVASASAEADINTASGIVVSVVSDGTRRTWT
jgi:hypothetical protein